MIYKRNLNLDRLSPKEKYVAEEILFHILVKHMFELYEDATKVMSLIDALCTVFGCNRSVILKATLKSTQIIPSRNTILILLYRAGLTVKEITDLMRVSSRTLYDILHVYKENPYPIELVKYSVLEHNEIILFLKEFNLLKELI